MKGFKKFLSTTLAALLVAGSASLTFAKSYDDVKEDDKFDVEISILSDLGVILGTSDDKFSPENDVTREQMAAILFRLMLGRDDAGRVNTTHFTDLYEPYYNGAISWATAAGFIKGVSASRFNPTGGITKQDAMTMLVRALGQSNESMDKGYPWSYINVAARLGLDKGLEDVAYTETLTRAETAKIVYNALVSDYLVSKNHNGSIVNITTSIIEEVFGYNIAEAILIATNDYAMNGSTVVKNGYVTLLANDGGKEFTMTVPADDLHMDGSANSNLGRTFKVIYRSESGRYSVLSSVLTTSVEAYQSATVNKNGTVTIGENVFTLVDELSDELSTNANELMLYAVGEDGSISIVNDAEELSQLKGFLKIELMNNDGKINVGIVKTYKMGELKIDKDGKINLADGKTESEISFIIPNGVKSGDIVLYRYNESAKELEIFKALEAVSGMVVRLTGTSVMIGENSYKLGNENAEISAESLRNQLSLGENATVLVHDGAVVAVVEGVKTLEKGKYLVSLSDAHLVYENGTFRYVMTAYVDGQTKNVYLKANGAVSGNVYRYTENDGILTLIPLTVDGSNIISGTGMFIQSDDEVGFAVNSANNTTITLTGKNHYSLSAGDAEYATTNGESGVQFVTDENTVIIVKDNGVMREVKGSYSSSITVKDGAKVVAVFDNEVGSVETLRYLYVSDGSLGNYDIDAQSVRILEKNGMVFIDGKVYTEYTVFSFADNKVKSMISGESELEVGADYRLGKDGTITSDKAEAMQSGVVNGYTAGTVTIGDKTYSVNGETQIVILTEDGKVGTTTVAGLYEMQVEFMQSNGVVTFILVDEAKAE